ncbi:MAG: LptA/OstA family protein [Alphaproteobacteria bacterium]|nr:MAG: hypothetical protein B6I23_00210 [Rickettsiaceae bacterium 4572_127]
MRLFLFFLLLPIVVFSKSNIELTATKALEWQMKSKSVVAIGSAKVVYNKMIITAERITGYYSDDGKNKNFYKLVAKGNVNIKNSSSKIETQKLEYNLTSEILILTGNPWTRLIHESALLSSKLPITFNNKTKEAKVKNAEIKHENRILTAPILTAYFSQSNSFEKAVTTGKTTLKTEEETLTSDSAEYDSKKGIATLKNNVFLKRTDGTTLKGGKLVYDMNKGFSRLYADNSSGKVIGIFEK